MKSLAISAVLAVVVHALLFTLNPTWFRPRSVRPPIPRSVTVTLAPVLPPQPASPKPVVAPLPLPQLAEIPHLEPLTFKEPPQPPKSKPKPTPRKKPVTRPAVQSKPASPAPVPQPSAPEPAAVAVAAPATTSGPVNPDARTDPSGVSQAPIQASYPRYDLNPKPEYPSLARRREYEGTVLLKVLVDVHGQAAQVKLLRTSGFDVLDRSALKSVATWRFEPARRNGKPIEMWVEVPVRFALQ